MSLFGFMFSVRARVRLVAIMLLVGASSRAQMPDVKGTMPEDVLPGLRKLLEAASRQSPQFLLKQIEMEMAAAQVTAARARMLPSLNTEMAYAVSRSAISGDTQTQTTNNGFFYTFNFNQPLFYFGELKRGLDIANLRETMAQRGFAEARRVLFLLLRQQYLGLVARKSALLHARATLDLARMEIGSARTRVELGIAPGGDVSAREMLLVERQLEFERVEEEYNRSRRALGRLAGFAEFPDDDIASAIPKPAVPLDTAAAVVGESLRRGGKNNFLAEIAEMRVREADLNYRNARVRQLPKFNIAAAHSLRNNTSANETSVSQTGITQQTVEVNARWLLWDSGASRAARLDARATRRIAERQLETTLEVNVDEILSQQKRLEFAQRGLAIFDQREEGARSVLRTTEADVAYGTTARVAIDQVQRDLYAAEAANANARATYFSEWSALVSLAGVDPLASVDPTSRHGR